MDLMHSIKIFYFATNTHSAYNGICSRIWCSVFCILYLLFFAIRSSPQPPAPVYKVDPAEFDPIRELKLKCIEVDRRKTFLQYQYDHFKLVSTGAYAFLFYLCVVCVVHGELRVKGGCVCITLEKSDRLGSFAL